jgi:hypothetical protein
MPWKRALHREAEQLHGCRPNRTVGKMYNAGVVAERWTSTVADSRSVGCSRQPALHVFGRRAPHPVRRGIEQLMTNSTVAATGPLA